MHRGNSALYRKVRPRKIFKYEEKQKLPTVDSRASCSANSAMRTAEKVLGALNFHLKDARIRYGMPLHIEFYTFYSITAQNIFEK